MHRLLVARFSKCIIDRVYFSQKITRPMSSFSQFNFDHQNDKKSNKFALIGSLGLAAGITYYGYSHFNNDKPDLFSNRFQTAACNGFPTNVRLVYG